MASIKKNILSSLFGNLVYAFGQYALLILFIKIFTKEEVGEYLFAVAFVTPINLGFDLQLRTLYVTENNKDTTFSDYYTFRILTNILSVAITLIAIVLYNDSYFYIVLIIAVIKAIETHLELLYGLYQSNHRLDFVAKSKIIRTVVSLSSVAVTVFFTKSILIGLWVYLLVWVLLFFFYEKPNVLKMKYIKMEDFRLSFDNKNLKYLVLSTSPLFFAILIDKYYANFPRLAIEKSLGLSELAIFGSLLYFKALAGQLISAIGQSTAPNLSAAFKQSNMRGFKKLMNKLILAGFLVGLIGLIIVYFFGDLLLTIIYNAEYSNYTNVLILILISASISFSYIFIGTAITCMRKQWVKLPISTMGLILIFLIFYFFPPKDLVEVAMTVLCMECVVFIAYFSIYIYYLKYVFKATNK